MTPPKIRDFLEEIAEMSERITIEEEVTADRTPSFTIMQPGIDSGIAFGQVFHSGMSLRSFILALLQVSGRAPKVEQAIQDRIKQISQPLPF